jgi:hypothetical protein
MEHPLSEATNFEFIFTRPTKRPKPGSALGCSRETSSLLKRELFLRRLDLLPELIAKNPEIHRTGPSTLYCPFLQ